MGSGDTLKLGYITRSSSKGGGADAKSQYIKHHAFMKNQRGVNGGGGGGGVGNMTQLSYHDQMVELYTTSG
jgi:hypothetical protein